MRNVTKGKKQQRRMYGIFIYLWEEKYRNPCYFNPSASALYGIGI